MVEKKRESIQFVHSLSFFFALYLYTYLLVSIPSFYIIAIIFVEWIVFAFWFARSWDVCILCVMFHWFIRLFLSCKHYHNWIDSFFVYSQLMLNVLDCHRESVDLFLFFLIQFDYSGRCVRIFIPQKRQTQKLNLEYTRAFSMCISITYMHIAWMKRV